MLQGGCIRHWYFWYHREIRFSAEENPRCWGDRWCLPRHTTDPITPQCWLEHCSPYGLTRIQMIFKGILWVCCSYGDFVVEDNTVEFQPFCWTWLGCSGVCLEMFGLSAYIKDFSSEFWMQAGQMYWEMTSKLPSGARRSAIPQQGLGAHDLLPRCLCQTLWSHLSDSAACICCLLPTLAPVASSAFGPVQASLSAEIHWEKIRGYDLNVTSEQQTSQVKLCLWASSWGVSH